MEKEGGGVEKMCIKIKGGVKNKGVYVKITYIFVDS